MKDRYVRVGDGLIRIFGAEPGGPIPQDESERALRQVQETRSAMKWTAWKLSAVLFALTTLIGLGEATQVYLGTGALGQGFSWVESASSTMPSWYVLAILLYPTLWLARHFRLDADGWRRALPVHLVASVAFTASHLALSSLFSDYILMPGPPRMEFLPNIARLFTTYFVIDTLFYWALIGGYYAFDYGRRLRERERTTFELGLKASRLETSLSRANLEALRMQLNPHFLFNTLNTISVLAMKGERQRVVRMINRLSDLLRLSLENSRQTMTLGEEVDFLQRYLEIEQVRFRDRLTVRVDVPEELLDAEVPSLVLQPIVENAVVHGVSRQLEGGSIDITARKEGDRLSLTVNDSGPGFGDVDGRSGTGVGLSNTAARLEQLYGADQEFRRENHPGGGALVNILIPYRVLSRDSQEDVEWKRSVL